MATKPRRKDHGPNWDRITAVLESQRALGPGSYPVTLERLLQLANEPTDAATAFLSRRSPAIAITAKRDATKAALLKAHAFLLSDLDSVVASDAIFLSVLTAKRTTATDLFTVADLAKHLPEALRTAFKLQLKARLDAGEFPDEVGCLSSKGTRYLFLMRWLGRPGNANGKPAARAGNGRAAEFEATFERLDRAKGNRNYVTLHELRRSLPYPREEFDRVLNELRRARRFTLDSSDGRQATLSDEERAAGIREGGALLVYVARA